MLYLYRVCLILFIIATFLLIDRDSFAQPASANVLYSDHPLPIRIGVDAGPTFTSFLNATPTYFATNYPFTDVADTIHMLFPNGATTGVGFTFGASADVGLSETWGLIAKVGYSQLRGGWHSVSQVAGISDSGNIIVPVTNDLQLTLRYLNFNAMLRKSFPVLHYLYVGAGFEYGALLSNNYSMTQSLGGPVELSFVDFKTGRGTGVRSYSITNSFGNFTTSRFALKLLAGYPIKIGRRWTLNPEATFAYPLTELFDAASRAEYQSQGFSATPNPIVFSLTLGLRYEL